jgi:hypothetical protein
MPQLDLSTYEGRQAARDQGYWVGDDGSGSIVAEYQGAPSGGGGGGGGSPQPAQQTGGSPAPAGGGGAVYQTKNGPRTVQQMEAELYAVGWGGPVGGTGGPGAIANAYARTTGGPVTEMAGQNYGAAAQNQMLPVNPQTGQQMDEATAEAYRRYLQWLSQSGADQYQLQLDRLGLERDRLSLDREKAATDMQLARNADARAEAMLRIQQADQALRENQFKQQQLEFEKTLTQRQTEFRQTQYSDLAKTLLQGAASLRGPRDWMQYAEFTGGGRNLYDQLYGSEEQPGLHRWQSSDQSGPAERSTATPDQPGLVGHHGPGCAAVDAGPSREGLYWARRLHARGLRTYHQRISTSGHRDSPNAQPLRCPSRCDVDAAARARKHSASDSRA